MKKANQGTMQHIVMLLSNSFKPDPRVLKEAKYLQSSGFDITILCWDRTAELPENETHPSGVKIIRIHNIHSTYGIGPRQLLRIPKFWMAAQQYLRSLNPVLIHCHDFDTLPAGLWFGRLHHVPVVYDAHEYYAELVKPRLNGIIGRLLFSLIQWAELIGARQARGVVTVDETLAAIYRSKNQNVIVLGHYPEKMMAVNDNLVFTRSTLTLLYVGRLSVDRGILIYAEIVRKLHEKGIPARLLLAGVFTPESEQFKFHDYAKSFFNLIEFLGWIPYEQLSHVYQEADIGLAVLLPEPRYMAAIPVKLFEYMANGLPVIASNFPSIAQIVNNEHCGLLVDPSADLSDSINTIAQWWQNKATPQVLGENGRQAVLSKYHWENQASRLLKLYQELI
jgi:glycosyltransferase involved in cell wall biosynthesis